MTSPTIPLVQDGARYRGPRAGSPRFRSSLLVVFLISATHLPAEEFELIDSPFIAVDRVSGGDFTLELAPLVGPVPTEPLSGGEFVVTGPDFWSMLLDETAAIRILLLPDGRFELRFSGPVAGAALEVSANLESWTPAIEALTNSEPLTLEPLPEQRFFRLRR